MTTPTWGDPAKQQADYTMSQVQGLVGNTADGRPRNQAPYYAFGALAEQSQVPGTQLPAIRWRQANGSWNQARVLPGNGTTGSLGSWLLDFEVKIFGADRAQTCDELLYLMWAVFGLQQPNPPITEFKTEWLEPGQAQQNGKETLQVTFSAPVMVPQLPTQVATVVTASAGFEMPSLMGSSSLPPVNGNYAVVRNVVVR